MWLPGWRSHSVSDMFTFRCDLTREFRWNSQEAASFFITRSINCAIMLSVKWKDLRNNGVHIKLAPQDVQFLQPRRHPVELGMAAHTFNPSTKEVEADGSYSRLA